MNTAILWLLIGVSSPHSNAQGSSPAAVIERFVTVQECERVKKLVIDTVANGYGRDAQYYSVNTQPRFNCIQATVARP